MTKKLVLLAFLPLLYATAFAGDTLWTRAFLAGDNCLPSVVRCHGTDVYVAGSATHDITMHGFLLKYSDTGFLEWSVDIDYDFYNMAMAMAVGPDGNPAVGLDVGFGVPVAKLVKFNSSGDTLWTRSYSGAAIDALAVGSGNDVFTLGTKGESGQESVWVAKHDANGTLQWSKTYRLAQNQLVYGLGVDGSDQLMAPLLLASDKREWSPLFKFSASGETLWSKTYTGNLLGIAVQLDGNALLLASSSLKKIRSDGSVVWSAGVSSGTVAEDVGIDPDGNGYIGYTDSQNDIKVRKYSSNGTPLWTMRCRTTSQDLPMSVAADAENHPVAAGLSVDGSIMQTLTIKFASVPGIADIPSSPVPGSAPRLSGTVQYGSAVHWHIYRPGKYEFSVFDQSGRLVMPAQTTRLAVGRHSVSVPEFANGVYFVLIEGPCGRSSASFIWLN